MERSRLEGVDRQMAQKGYTKHVLTEGLEKRDAEELRDIVREAYADIGYTYQTRPQLS